MTAEEQRELAREIDEAVRQGALAAGKLGSGMDRDMVELLQPQVDWREVLRDFVQTTCQGNDYSTWRRPNRRYIGAGIYMPSGISEQIGEIVVAIDTSGSIGARELGVFLAEIKEVADTVHPEAIRILYWDTKVCGDERYEGAEVDNIVQSTKPKGGGGTDVRCVPQYLQDKQIKAQAVIVLTDGYLFGGWGQWHHPGPVDHIGQRPRCARRGQGSAREIEGLVMGYRSDVIIAYVFKTKEQLDEVMAIYRMHPFVQTLDLAKEWEVHDWDGTWGLTYQVEGTKWYDIYEDVQGYEHMFDLVQQFVEERDMFLYAYRKIRLGEDDADTEYCDDSNDPDGELVGELSERISVRRDISTDF
jgi:hypothetical protein